MEDNSYEAKRCSDTKLFVANQACSIYLVDGVFVSYTTFYFHSDALTRFCLLNFHVLYLHGIYTLFNVCGRSLDENLISHRNSVRYLYNCHINPSEEM